MLSNLGVLCEKPGSLTQHGLVVFCGLSTRPTALLRPVEHRGDGAPHLGPQLGSVDLKSRLGELGENHGSRTAT